jgi:AraC-like DNA-binding protein
MDLYLSLIRIGASLMLTFVAFSQSYRINKNANSYLAMLFGVLTILFISTDVGEYISEKWIWLYAINILENNTILIPSFLYIAVYHFVHAPANFLKKHYLLFLPFLFVAIFEMFSIWAETHSLALEDFIDTLDFIFLIGLWIFSLILFYWVVKMLANHHENVLKFHANTQGVDLNWLYKLMFIFPIYFIPQVVFYFISNQYYLTNISDITLFFMLFYSGFHIVQQREIFDLTMQGKVLAEKEIPEQIDVEKEGLIDEHLMLEIVNNLEKVMKEEKPYLNQYLSLNLLADKLNSRTHIVSYVINTHYNVNFYNYINNFRFDYCKALLKNQKKQHLSIEGIALEGGFGSKSTFNTLFKKQSGMTPTQYKNTNNQ